MVLTVEHKSSDNVKHGQNVSVVFNLDGNIISASDEGKIKVWTKTLAPIYEADTNSGAILSLAAGPQSIYTCTSDGTIQMRSRTQLEEAKTLNTTLVTPQKVCYEPETNEFWAGDALGKVGRFSNDEEQGTFELTEEIWDMHVTTDPTLIFTARDRDVVAFEIVKGEVRSNAVVRATISGRYPLYIKKSFVCCLDREGRKIQIHENSVDSKFKLLREIQASELIINAMCGTNDDVDVAYTGGYDNKVSKWDLRTGEKIDSVDVGSCVNCLSPTDNGVVAALSDGNIVVIAGQIHMANGGF